MNKQNTDEDAVLEVFGEHHTTEQFEINRNTGLAAAGVCLAILLTAIQMDTKSEEINYASIFATIGIPIWLLTSSINEYFVFIGEKIFPFYSKVKYLLRITNSCGCILLLLALTNLAAEVSDTGKYSFLVSSAICIITFQAFHLRLSKWLKHGEKT
jgi:hypothetical protein